MNAFDPAQHPRGNASTGHSGQFARKEQTVSEVSLGPAERERLQYGKTARDAYREAFGRARNAAGAAHCAYLNSVLTQKHPDLRCLVVDRDEQGKLTRASVYTSAMPSSSPVATAGTTLQLLDQLGVTDQRERADLVDSYLFKPSVTGRTAITNITAPGDNPPGDTMADTDTVRLLNPQQSTGTDITFPDGQQLSVTAWTGVDGSPVISVETGYGDTRGGNVRIALNDANVFNANPETDVYEDHSDQYEHACRVAGLDPDRL